MVLEFTEDRTNTYQKGEHELQKVIMCYKDGTTQEITDVEPTMVLVGYSDFIKLRDEHKLFKELLTKNIEYLKYV